MPQIEVPPAGSGPVVTLSNAAQSTIKGFEAEGVAVPADWLRTGYGYANLDARFDYYLYSPTLDFSGNRLARSPKNTVDLAGIVTVPVGENRLEVRGAMNYLSSFQFEPDNAMVDPGTRAVRSGRDPHPRPVQRGDLRAQPDRQGQSLLRPHHFRGAAG